MSVQGIHMNTTIRHYNIPAAACLHNSIFKPTFNSTRHLWHRVSSVKLVARSTFDSSYLFHESHTLRPPLSHWNIRAVWLDQGQVWHYCRLPPNRHTNRHAHRNEALAHYRMCCHGNETTHNHCECVSWWVTPCSSWFMFAEGLFLLLHVCSPVALCEHQLVNNHIYMRSIFWIESLKFIGQYLNTRWPHYFHSAHDYRCVSVCVWMCVWKRQDGIVNLCP